MSALKTLPRLFSLLALLSSVGSAASLQVLPWNNYSFRVLGGGFPSLPPALDASGVMVTVADNTLPVEAIFVVTVVYKVGDDLRTAETHVKVWHGSATTIIVLGKHDEDFKVLKVTALPYVPAGPATEAEL